uniref:Reverse transcriptase/retrotransposon-derived protein RNase H-like domain-containing protein n=1 Tax=Lepisosteus oculatus TaxID=7918 RepID=W5NLA8_LEPOC
MSDMTHALGLTMTDCLTWTPDGEKAFVDLKRALISAPALGLPDMTKGFTLTVDDRHGFYSAVLLQAHGDRFKPVAYYSQCLTSVARGLPVCLCAVAAAAAAVMASAPLVCYHPLMVLVPHAVASILLQSKTSYFSPTSTPHYHYILLSLPHVTIEQCKVLNPATLLPTEDEGEPHDCTAA